MEKFSIECRQDKINEIMMAIQTGIYTVLTLIFFFCFLENVHQCEEHRGTKDGGLSQDRHFVINDTLTTCWGYCQ